MDNYLTWLIVVSLTVAIGSVLVALLLAVWVLIRNVFGR